ncbi:MAG: enoyl-CoA hydratase/isomerase family protein [Promethearchaeota archaeon]
MSVKKEFKHIKIEKVEEGNYAVISINRPDRLNALQLLTIQEIAEALEPMAVDPNIRCVVLRGTKDFTKKPAFSAGADLATKLNQDEETPSLISQCDYKYKRHKCYDLIEEFPKIIIAAVDGFALGGGFELTLVCDIVIASKRSVFGFPEIKRGIFPADGGTQRLVRSLGKVRAKQMMVFGDHYSAEQIYEWGLISYLVDDDKFEDFVHEKASYIGNAATNSLFVIKKCINYGTQVPLKIGMQFEELGFGVNAYSEDVREGINSFLERRPPKFKGR